METEWERDVAVQAELCFLLNLLVLPGVAFVALLLIARQHWHSDNALTRCHLRQAMRACIWSGVLLAIVSLIIVGIGDWHSVWTWMVLLLYFICCHSALILFGVWGVTQALAGKYFVYPVIGVKQW
ncbi:MAG: hypothetical protein U1F55_06445 [Chitinivorax sp.]